MNCIVKDLFSCANRYNMINKNVSIFELALCENKNKSRALRPSQPPLPHTLTDGVRICQFINSYKFLNIFVCTALGTAKEN